MGDKYNSTKGSNELDRKANAWFDQTDDTRPFDAFGSGANKKRVGNEIYSRIHKDIHYKRYTPFFFMKVAAAVLIIVFTGITTSRYFTDLQIKKNQLTWTVFSSGIGEYKKITLPDSSVVYLRPGTKLEAPASFRETQRTVKLIEGEAYFEVKHDTQHPFIVKAAQLSTQVLGTSFIIKNYQSLKNIQVSVTTGKVAVKNDKAVLGLLTPRQQITFNTLNRKATFETTGSDLAETWKSGEYILNDVAVDELALTLKNVYGVNLIFKANIPDPLHITTQFNKKDNIRDILEQLKLIHGLKYRMTNNKEVILMK